MRPFDFTSPSPVMTASRKATDRPQVAPHWDGFKFGRDLIGAVIVSTGTFAVFWMIAMINAIMFLNR